MFSCIFMLNIMVLFVVIYSAFSTYSCITYAFFKLSKLLGGGQNDMFLPPHIFIGGRLPPCPPPPPRIDASVSQNEMCVNNNTRQEKQTFGLEVFVLKKRQKKRQKKLITSSGRRSLKSTASKLIIFGNKISFNTS